MIKPENLPDYIEFLEKWNEKINLVSYRSIKELYIDHILDSLAIREGIILKGNIADIGTGPGLPGLVLGLAYPDAGFMLIEPKKKYYKFLQKTLSRLKPGNIRIAKIPAEKDPDIKKHDIFITRAVASMHDLCRLIAPSSGAVIVFYKAGNIFRELQSGVPDGYRFLLLRKIKILETYNKNHYIMALIKD